MGNKNSGAKGRKHQCWSGGIRYLTTVDDLLIVSEEDINSMKQWVRTKTTYNKQTRCREWKGRTDRHGYGMVGINKRTAIAHRFVWVLYKRVALDRQQILHTCDNPRCVNLKHLFIGTHADNMTDMVSKGRSPDNAGENNPRSVLTSENVKHIRRSKLPHRLLSLTYGVSEATIKDVRGGRTWKTI